VGLLRGESEMSFSFSFLVELCYFISCRGKGVLEMDELTKVESG
jgi:hypothetical protein